MTLITCDHKYFVARCAERCHNLGEASGCVVRTDGDLWTIDTSSPLYPAESRCPPGERRVVESVTRVIPKPPEPKGGPGTELKALLKEWLGIVATPTCSCNAMARKMDERGVEWTLSAEGMAEVLSVMRAEHAKRKAAGATALPWTDLGATQLVRLACRRARARAAKC